MSRLHARIKGARWEATRRRVFDRDGWRCTQCGKAGALRCHHKQELRHGGKAFDPANLVTFCKSCHLSHHKKPRPPTPWDALVAELAAHP